MMGKYLYTLPGILDLTAYCNALLFVMKLQDLQHVTI